MLKKTLSFLMIISILLLNFNPSTINAQDEDYDSKYIKVGLERNISSKNNIKLSGEGFSIGTESRNISEQFRVSNQEVVAKIKNFSYHIELSERFDSYNRALEKANQLISSRIDAYVVYDQGFKVWIGEFANENSANQFLTESYILSSENTYILKNESLVSIESLNGEKIILFDRNQNMYLKSLGELTTIEGKRYRGYVGFANNQNKLTVVNYIQIGDYLKGVVPREMSASWNIEALKAQAVSARNYTLRNLGKHKNLGYDLCDTTNCQVYDGYGIEHINTNRAVDETRNKVLRYNGELAQTFYYSCSGGYTANNEDAWSGTPIPYLRGKKDPYSIDTPQSNWTYTISKGEASSKLKAKGYDVGQIISMETTRDNLGGRVLELKITGTSGTKVVSKEKIRDVFGYSNVKSTNYRIEGLGGNGVPVPEPPKPITPTTENHIYIISSDDINSNKNSMENLNVISSEGIKKVDINLQDIVISNGVEKIIKTTKISQEGNNQLSNTNSNNTETGSIGDSIVFKGSGWGHGVGMSQYGALNMAKAGHDFREILEFYFTGTRVE